jgi:hypothetical protein
MPFLRTVLSLVRALVKQARGSGGYPSKGHPHRDGAGIYGPRLMFGKIMTMILRSLYS